MKPSVPETPERLFTYDFVVLTLAATFGFCNIAVFYGLANHLQRLGVDPAWRGAVIAAEPLAAFLTRPLLSFWLTPRQALTMARLALVALGLALPGYLFAQTIPLLFAVRIFHGLAFVCLVSAVVTLLTKVVGPNLAGRAFSLFSLSSLVPYMLMPPLAGWALNYAGNEARVYAWTALLTLPALALLAPLGKRLGRNSFPAADWPRPSLGEIRVNLGQIPVVLLLGANLLVFTGTTQVFFYLKSYAVARGLGHPEMFFTVSTAASIAARLGAGRFNDQLPRRLTTMLALLGLCTCMALFTLIKGNPSFMALAAVYGLGLGLALPLLNTVMFLESRPALRGMNINLMLFMMDAGYTLGPIVGGGLLAGQGGFPAMFALGAACLACAAGLIAPLAFREWSPGA